MATTISTQDIVDAKRDIDDIGKAVNEKVIVSPRYGDDFKSLPMIATEAQSTIGEWEAAISLITQEGGVPALAVSDASGKTQQAVNNDQLIENEAIRSDITKVESYIVYAEKYGASLNEAMTAINTEFSGQRVRVYVPSDFPVTATVNLDIDCDLDLSTLKVQNDIDVIFEPIEGWSGSSTPCVVDVNYKSCRLGWSMKKALGEVSIDRCTFKNIGNQALNTSADYWFGFFISTVDIKKLDLFYPTTINSYVKPNSVVGDNIGVNRNILIEGVFTASSVASNINIYNHTAIDLYTSEDADSLCINTGSSSILNAMHNIDIYDGFCENVQKRMYKLMLRQKCKGIRLHGISIAIAGGDKPYCAMDLYGDGDLVADGAIYGTGWIIGVNSSESTNFMGSTYKANFVMTKAVVDGNQVRALNQTGATASTVELLELSGTGGTELFVTQATHTVKIGTAKHDTWSRAASITGKCTIDKFDITMVNPLETVARAPYLIAMGNNIKIKNVTFNSTVAEDQQFLFQTLGFSNIEIEGVTAVNGLSGAVMRMVTANNIKLSKVKAPTVAAIARCETGGSNLLLNLCTTPTSGVTVQQVHSVNPMTNVVELNKLTF